MTALIEASKAKEVTKLHSILHHDNDNEAVEVTSPRHRFQRRLRPENEHDERRLAT